VKNGQKTINATEPCPLAYFISYFIGNQIATNKVREVGKIYIYKILYL